MTNKVIYSIATQSDAADFFGGMPVMSFRGYVAKLSGEVVGIGGVYYDHGKAVAFSSMSDELRARKKDIARGIRMLESFFESLAIPLYAVANQDEPTSTYLLCRLGFLPTGIIGDMGEIMERK